MTVIESAWPKYPDYRIDLVPVPQTGRVWFGDLLLAETNDALLLEETRHVDRLYIPHRDVKWEHFTFSEGIHTICPFKGEADYWDLTAVDPVETNIVWAYPTPFDEVAGIKDYVCFYQERTRIEIDEPWPDDPPGYVRRRRFPAWGDAAELLGLMDVEQMGEGRFVAPAYGETSRDVVEGGQQIGAAIVAACKTVPGQRVTSAFMTFSKSVAHSQSQELSAEVLRAGRSFSTVEVRVKQEGTFRSAALMMLGAENDDVIRGVAPMSTDVPGPEEAVFLDMGVPGRELRIVDAAYDPDPDRLGPPEIYAWCRFRDNPAEQYLRTALIAQSMTHWTIAAAMRPHSGFGEARAHVDLSTGVLNLAVSFHEDMDVREWLLYTNLAIYAGRGLAQGEGRVYTRDGRLVANYSCQVMIRGFKVEPAAMGLDAGRVM